MGLVLEVQVQSDLLVLGLYFDRWALFDQNTIFKHAHQGTLEKRLVLDLQVGQQVTVFFSVVAVSFEIKQGQELVI